MKASDFLKQLEKDKSYQEKQHQEKEEIEKKTAEIKIIESPFVKDLHDHGFSEIKSASDLLKLKKINLEMTELILKWMPNLSNKYHSQEMLARALAITDKPFNGILLTELFDKNESPFSLKWAIANTIASTQVNNITNWLTHKLAAIEQPKENEMLVYAAIRYFSYEEASRYLKSLFRIFPLQVADAFTYIGRHDDFVFLKNHSGGFKGEVKDKIDIAVKKLRAKTA